MQAGKLYLIPSPIFESKTDNQLFAYLIPLINELDVFFVENLRTTRRFFSRIGIRNIENIQFELLNKYTSHREVESLLGMVKSGKNAGILSEAGCPGIADPGSIAVKLAHIQNIRIVPMAGPSSIFMALMASGFNGQNFTFHGYLPIDKKDRKAQVRNIEKLVYSKDQTQILMETPYRNNQLLGDLVQSLQPETLLCIASDLSGAEEFIRTKPIRIWKNNLPDIHKKPTMFLIYK